jgi:hypothetical protein
MITVKGIKLREERDLIRDFVKFVLNHFVSPGRIKKADIKILAVRSSDLPADEQEEFDEAGAWMTYDGTVNGRKKFTITLAVDTIKTRGNVLRRMKDFIHTLAHEMVHVKQYLNHELFDYKDGKRARFRGRVHAVSTSSKMDWVYYESPWEIEAYGRSTGLRDVFYIMKGWED